MATGNFRDLNGLNLKNVLQEMEKSSSVDLVVRSYILTWVASQNIAPREKKILNSEYKNFHVFSYWHSGFDDSPPIVRACIQSHKKYFGDNYVALNSGNISDWVVIPKRISDLRSSMSETHFSDVLRLLLLERHGGLWLDSTVLLTGEPSLHSNLDFFCFSRDRDPRLLANWWIEARPGAYLVEQWLGYLLAYWDQHNYLIDYYIMHHLFEALYLLDEKFREAWNSVPFVSANAPHLLQENLSKPFEREKFSLMLSESSVHKLTWKLPDDICPDANLNFLLNSKE